MAKRLNYQIGFTADTSSLIQAVNQAMASLSRLGSSVDFQLTKQLQDGAKAARELNVHLQNAINQDTGKFDLINFSQSLKRSGKDLEYYAKQLEQLGPQGEQAFLEMARAVTSAELPLKRSHKLLDQLWTTMKNTARWQLTASALHGFTGAIQTAYGYAKNLNESLNNIRIVTSKSNEEMGKFAEQANRAAQALNTTTTKYTDASLIYYQQGLSDEEVKERTDATVKFANVSRQAAETASEQLTSIWNNFYDGSKSLEYYIDVMVRLGAETASSSEEISQGVQKFAATADTIGLSYEYAAAALATVTATTRQSADVVGTAFKTLFARIQDLELGETLEDGTTLGSYSKALEDVGINIKTANGDLKDMDTILNELGNKWATINKDQQVALAQTVAGVRQYTQLIALLDNWSFFQKNLTSAYGAEGTLNQQAEIYAESWEAARDRVTAATENIYDSLVNDQFFIDLDNSITPVINGIATVIDTFGGLGGVASVAGTLILKIYGDKIAESMRNLATSVGLVTGKEQERLRTLQAIAAQEVENLTQTAEKSDDLVYSSRIDLMRKEVETRAIINQQMDSMSALEREQVNFELQKLEILKNGTNELLTQLEASQEWANRAKEILLFQEGFKAQLSSENMEAQKENLTKALGAEAFEEFSKKGADQFEIITNKLSEVITKKAGLQKLSDELKKIEGTGKSLAPTFQSIARELGYIDSTPTIEDLDKELLEAKDAVTILNNALKSMGEGTPTQILQIEKAINAYNNALTSTGNSTQAVKVAMKTLGQDFDDFNEQLQTNAFETQDWASLFVRASSSLMQVATVINTLKGAYSVFSDEDATAVEKTVAALTALGTVLPIVIGLYKTLTATKEAKIIVDGVEQTITRRGIAGIITEIAAKKAAAAATQADTSATIANTVAKYASNWILLAITAAIAALVAAIWLSVKAYNADAEAAKKAAETAQELKNAYDDVKTSYDALKTSLSEYQEARNGLDELVKGTDEWNEAVRNLNAQVLELLDAYPQLAQYISNEDGLLSISQEGQKALLEQQEARLNAAYQAQLQGQSYANFTDSQSRITDFRRMNQIIVGTGESAYVETLSEKSAEALIDALDEQGISILENSETLMEATGLSQEWANEIISNRDAAISLAEAVKANTESNKILAGQMGQSMLQDTQYANSVYSDQLAQIVGQTATNLYNDKYQQEYSDRAFGIWDKDIQDQYAELMGYQALNDLSGNKGEYLVNGEIVTIADEVARAAIAQQKAQEEAMTQLESYVTALDNLTAATVSQDETVQGAVANLGVGINDYSQLTKDQVDTLRNLDLSSVTDETLNTLGTTRDELTEMHNTAVANFDEGMENITSDMARSVQEAFERLEKEGKSLADLQAIADILALASAYGKLDEAIDAYHAGTLEEFAEGIKDVVDSLESFTKRYAAIHKIIDDIATGDTISQEDYETLGAGAEQYFNYMLDGTYRLISNAAEFREAMQQNLINEAITYRNTQRSSNADLERIQGYDFKALSQSTSYQDESGKWYFNPTDTQKQIDILRALGDQSDETLEKLNKWQQDLDDKTGVFESTNADLQELANMVAACDTSVEHINETMADGEAKAIGWELAIANSYESLPELRDAWKQNVIEVEAFNAAAANLDKITDTEMLDPEEWEEFSDYLRESADEMEGLNDEMTDNEARIVAKGIMKMNDAIDELSGNFENWSDIIQNSSEDSEEFADAMEDCRTAVANLLDVNEDFVSSDFISENLNLIEQAANGSEAAIDQLKAKLVDSIVARIVIDNELQGYDLLGEVANLQTMLDELGPIKVGATVENEEFIKACNDVIKNAGLTADQANALFDAIGFETTFKTEQVPVTRIGHETITTTRVDEWGEVTMADGSIQRYPAKMSTKTDAGAPYTYTEYVDAIAMDSTAEGSGGGSPIITGLTKKATGGYSNYSSRNTGGPSPGGSSGGGGGGNSEGTKYDAEEEKELEERYHEITRAIQRQADVLEDLENQMDRTYGLGRLDLYKASIEELNEQADNQLQKMREAQSYLQVDKAAVNAAFDGAAIYNANGEIANYSALLRQTVDEYNNGFLADYNAFLMEYSALTKDEQEARKAEYESWQAQKEAAEAQFEDRQAVLKQYEETLDVIQEMKDAYEDTMRQIEDQKLEAVTYKMEVILDVKNVKDAAEEFSKAIVESFGDELTHGLGSAAISYDQALLEKDLLPHYLEQYAELQQLMNEANQYTDTTAIVDAMKELQSNVISSGEALLAWIETVETMLPDAIDAARERFSLFTDQLDHNSSVLSTIKELLSLQGVTYKSMQGFTALQKVAREQVDAATASAQLNKQWYDESREALLRAEEALVGVSETDVAYDTLKNNRDALLAEFNEAEEAMLSSAQEAMEAAQEMYLNAVEKAVYDFGQAVSNGIGLDLLQDKYDHYIEEEGRYLDKVNEAYEVSSWYNKLQQDIDNTTNSMYKERLKALQEEIDMRRDGNTLSEYDLEILNAKYQVLQAQMALEDAQNAKNQLRLVRDSQGNWNYQYSADAGAIADAEAELLAAENEWYNIAKQQVQDVTGEIINTWTECSEAIREIYSDMTLTDEERADRAAEIYEYYTEKIKFLEEEKQNSVLDMTEAGNKALLDNAIITGDEITDLTGITSAEIQNIIAESGMSIIDLLLADNETIKDIVGSNTELIDLFENVFAQDLGKMTENTGKFESYFQQAMDNVSQAFTDYGDTIAEVSGYAGTSVEELTYKTDVLSDSTDRCRDAGIEATQAMWETIDAVQSASMSYIELADSIMEAVYAMEELARAQASQIESYSNMDTSWGGDDYSLDDFETPSFTNLGGSGTGGSGGSGGGTYTVKSGDNLWDIARDLYGSGRDWETLYNKNKAMIDQQAKASGLTNVNPADGWWIFPGQVLSFRTGGYTGEFSDAKMAFLHEKELVLNQDDTKNILTAVAAIRTLGPEIFSDIEKILDSNASAGAALMAQRLGGFGGAIPQNGEPLEQHITIEHVEFPNVTSASEINNAFASLVNDAAQWARRRKE